jgi:hypothetical protein
MANVYNMGLPYSKIPKEGEMDAKKVKIVSLLGASMGLLCILLVSNIYVSLHDHDGILWI